MRGGIIMGKSATDRSSKARNDRCVQGTNDSSVLSKCSMSAAGYFEDSFLRHFVSKLTRRAPLIHRGYYIRARAIQRCFDLFLSSDNDDAEAGRRQIVSLGAGFDATYFRLKAKGQIDDRDVYVEIDFLPLCQRKASLIRQNELLSDILQLAVNDDDVVAGNRSPEIVIDTPNYKLLGVDLSNIPLLDACLSSIALSFDAPTLLLSEVVLPYMGPRVSNNLIKWANDSFRNSFFVSYEQVNPSDAFGLIMMKHFNSLGSPLKYITRYPDVSSIEERYRAVGGWSHLRIVDMNAFYLHALSPSERRRVLRMESFDEEEEWHQKCAHYVIVAAAKGTQTRLLDDVAKEDRESPSSAPLPHSISTPPPPMSPLPLSSLPDPTLVWTFHRSATQSFRRFGHSLTEISPIGGSTTSSMPFVLVIAGFGNFDGRHARKAAVDVIDATNLRRVDDVVVRGIEAVGDRLFHSTTAIDNETLVLFGGRASPAKPFAHPVSITFSTSFSSSSSDDSPSFVVEATPLITSGNEPTPRWRHSATLLSRGRDQSSRLLVYGGKTSHDVVTNEAFLFDCGERRWMQMTNEDHAPALCSHTANAWKDDSVVVFGGLDAEFSSSNAAFLWNVERETIEVMTPRCGRLEARFGHSAIVENDVLILVGGVNASSDSVPGVALLDLVTLQATEFKIPALFDEEILMLRNHQSFLRDKGDAEKEEKEIVIVGGGGNCFSFGTHFNADFFSFELPYSLF